MQSRRRKQGESLQSVYNDIRRLLALSFPWHSGEVCEVLGRDAFLTALGDQSLRVRVLDQQPATLDGALAIACRMEAYGATTAASDDLSAAESDRPDRRRVRAVNVESKEVKVERHQLQRLESELADQRRQIRQLQAESDHWKARAESAAPPPVLPPTPWWPPPASGLYPPYVWTDNGFGPSTVVRRGACAGCLLNAAGETIVGATSHVPEGP